ncbi:MAG: outer membrane protein transport protein [Deltaproteobacteria bacterium]|nr:outer membrane protein transport protein [Deltaproteobacteria bacterium]
MPHWFVIWASLGAATLAWTATSAEASVISSPSLGGRNSGMGGADVATPEDGPGILLSNPAGVVGQSGTRFNVSWFTIFFDGHYQRPDLGYDTKSSEIPIAPTLWLSTDRLAPWFVGAGVYGSVGASFNFPGNPAVGIPNRFFSEMTTIHLGLVAGREIAPGLRLAIQPMPTYGRARAHYPSPFGPVSFDIAGAGIAGMVGLLYDVDERTTLGVGYRSPGIVYMSGDGEVGPAAEHVDWNLHLPQSVNFGLARQITPRLLVAANARWTDYGQFEKGQLDFRAAEHAALDHGPFSATRATFRYGLGLEYALVKDHVWLRGGASREQWMMEGSSLSPVIYDTGDVLFAIGLGAAYANWGVDFIAGIPYQEDRVVTAAENPAFPGRYSGGGGVAGISVTYRLD